MATSNKLVKRSKGSWSLDFTSKRLNELPSPPGYCATLAQAHVEAAKDVDNMLIVKKSWDIALAPLKQVPMNLFIMYMAGNSISIFPIMMVGMLFLRPVKALLSIHNTFRIIEGARAMTQKFVYLLGNVACLALALYKCQSMGLLPTHASDWLEFVEAQKRLEFFGGGLLL